MNQNLYKKGDWNAICDRCGRKYKASQLRREWTGLYVCHGPNTSDCWDERHPQLNVKAVTDQQKVPWTRPEPTDVELDVCSVAGRSAICGLAVVGCAIVGNSNYSDADYSVPSSTFNITDTINN